ncbi:hypothetical protein [Methanococcoides alaskense]|uniref:Uncharacterized protein n=1 Tax=Methanococcoides alaskense TaxID=325778 RepID=A0AA90TXM8_9EURY|nr:hypothetical protein [Methanococcoides alaskense]MDR6221830.1 hypothetical protein [Methanococcoides alaskense]
MQIQESLSGLIIYEMRVDIRTHNCDESMPDDMNKVNLIADPTEEDCPDFTGICHSIKL